MNDTETKKPSEEGLIANSLQFGCSAVKLCLSPHGHILTIPYIPCQCLSSQMDSQFGRDRKQAIGFIRNVGCLEDSARCSQEPKSYAYSNSYRKHKGFRVSYISITVMFLYSLAFGNPLPQQSET